MKDNNDPIQEAKIFRKGLINLTEDEENYTEYNNLHNCSNDLSDRGSRLEEFEHAKFAEMQRKIQQNYNTNRQVKISGNGKWIVYLFIFLFVGIPMLEIIMGMFLTYFEFNDYEKSNEPSSYVQKENDDTAENSYYLSALSKQKNNISVSGKIVEGQNMMAVETKNLNNKNISFYKVQVIFFDKDDEPIYVSDINIEELKPNEIQKNVIYDIPSDLDRYEFLITEKYSGNEPYVIKY